MRQEHDVLELEQAGMHDGLALVDVEPGSRDLTAPERFRQRFLIDYRAARRVDEERARFHPSQCRIVDQMVRLLGERAVQRDDVRRLEKLLQGEEARVELRLERFRCAPPTGVHDAHPACTGTPRGRRADLPEADDAERLPLNARAEHEPHVPGPRGAAADEPLALAKTPRGHQDQRERDVGSRFGEHTGSVRGDDAPRSACSDVDVVVADRDVRDDTQTIARCVEKRSVHPIVQQSDDSVCAVHRIMELLDRQRPVVRRNPGLPGCPQELESRLRD